MTEWSITITCWSITCSVSNKSLAKIYAILRSSFVMTAWILCVVAVCIKDAKTAVSGGQVSRKLSYKDHVLELTYEGGSPCEANPNLRHKTIIHFICRYSKLALCLCLYFYVRKLILRFKQAWFSLSWILSNATSQGCHSHKICVQQTSTFHSPPSSSHLIPIQGDIIGVF